MSGVSVRLATTDAVTGLTIDVLPEQWLAVIGPNGAGKTTLLRCLAALVRYTGGVRIAGHEVATLRRKALARTVAYVPQHPVFPADMTVGDYILLGRTAYTGRVGVPSRPDRRVCGEILGRLDLARFADRRVGSMSGGERQRLVLARGLAQAAPVLLLDEPTSALDLGRRVDALELVDDLRVERGLTIVSVIHDLTLAGQFADRLALMDRGRLVADGSPEEVLRDDILGRTFAGPIRVLRHDGDLVVTSQRPHPSTLGARHDQVPAANPRSC